MNPWLLVAIIAFAISAIALAVGIFIFIRFNIPNVIGDLNGKNVEREIRAIREGNSKTGKKRHKTSAVNSARGPVTDKVTGRQYDASAISQGHKSKRLSNSPSPNDGNETLPLGAAGTTPLQEPETTPLQEPGTMPLQGDTTLPLGAPDTTPLQEPGTMPLQALPLEGEGTMLLNEGTTTLDNAQPKQAPTKVNFNVTQTVMLVHTEENINE